MKVRNKVLGLVGVLTMGMLMMGCDLVFPPPNEDLKAISEKVHSIGIVSMGVNTRTPLVVSGTSGKIYQGIDMERLKYEPEMLNEDKKFLHAFGEGIYDALLTSKRFKFINKADILKGEKYRSLQEVKESHFVNIHDLKEIELDSEIAKELAKELKVDAVAQVWLTFRNGRVVSIPFFFPERYFVDIFLKIVMFDKEGNKILNYSGMVESDMIEGVALDTPQFTLQLHNADLIKSTAKKFLNSLKVTLKKLERV